MAVKADPLAGQLVWGFKKPMQLGQITSKTMKHWDANKKPLGGIPMMILGEATRKDWERSVRDNGGDPDDDTSSWYFYFVSVD